MNKYVSRLTSSARGEAFNPLIWPLLFSTFAYGVGFALIFPLTRYTSESSLYTSMLYIDKNVPAIWGAIALVNIAGGLTFLLFNIPPFGKVSGLVGFMLWVFAGLCYSLDGEWLVLFAVAVPNMWFWFWQYLSLSLFRREDALDKRTMQRYDAGEYDDKKHPEQSRIEREDNRGVDTDDRTPD